MSGIQHRDLAAGQWSGMSLVEQLGHVGSEVSRAARWRGRNDERSRQAFYRALELLDLTRADSRHRRSRPTLRELGRAREVVADFFAGDNRYSSTAESLQKYFDAFARAAQQKRAQAANRVPID
jgi:hypothetical protein